jgi:hypothetical protein
MTLVTGSTPEWGYEKSSVKDMLHEPFSSRPVDRGAGAVGTNKRFLEDSHDKPLPVLSGPLLYIQRPCVAIYREWQGQGSSVTRFSLLGLQRLAALSSNLQKA